MIVLDIESSGLDTGKCGIWQIGAIDLENIDNFFFEESRIDDGDLVEQGALKVTGKTEEELRDKNKQSQKQLIDNFLKWTKTCKIKIIIGQNIGWDISLLQNKCRKYNLNDKFYENIGFKGIDLYALAQLKHLEYMGKYKLKENGRGDFNLSKVLEFCGIPDTRIDIRNPKTGEKEIQIIQEGTPHNALEDCKLEGECFSRLMYGKNLFSEYKKHPIPNYLLKISEESKP